MMGQGSKKRAPEPPARPKPKAWFDPEYSFWIILDPAKVALLGGTLFATLTLLFYFVYQGMGGGAVSPMTVAVRVGLVFVVSYTATGVFSYYLLRVADRELEPEDDEDEAPQEAAVENESATPDDATHPSETPIEPIPEEPE